MATYPPAIAKALHQVMTKVGYVQKKDRNDFQKYNYAGEGALLDVLRPAMVEAGLVLIPSVETLSEVDQYGNVSVRIAYTLAHSSGEVWPDKIYAVGMGNDKNSKGGIGDKGTYKAITGANKYLLFKLFQIETGNDPEVADGEPDAPAKKAPAKAAAKQPTAGQPTLDNRYQTVNRALGAARDAADLDKIWRRAGWTGPDTEPEGLLAELKAADPEKYNALSVARDLMSHRFETPFDDQEAA